MFTEQERQDGVARMEEFCAGHYVIAGSGSRSYKRTEKIYGDLCASLTVAKHEHKDLIVMSGAAQGWDTELARVAYGIGVPYVLAIPSPDYGPYYWKDDLERFKTMVKLAELTCFVCPGHGYGRANHTRNEFMVEYGDEFHMFDPSSRGTGHCFRLIREAGKPYKIYQ